MLRVTVLGAGGRSQEAEGSSGGGSGTRCALTTVLWLYWRTVLSKVPPQVMMVMTSSDVGPTMSSTGAALASKELRAITA
jgi:hypothetical protein